MVRRRSGRVRLIEPLEQRLALSGDPIVTVDTNFGNFQIELLPSAAPQTVANFLSYVESGAYTDTVFHRSVQPTSANPGNLGIIQAGGFTSSSATFTGVSQFQTIPTKSPIPLEYDLANAAGTIAMARTSNQNSATDEFFINDVDNSTTLGQSNGGGYAVFGKILGNGMQVVNQIAALSPTNVEPNNQNSPFSELPLGANNQLAQITSITLDSIDGTVFTDTNDNGTLDSGETGVAGRTVFIDKDGSGKADGTNPQTTTDAHGNFSFTGLTPGTYTVREVLPNGYTLSTGTQGALTVTVTANQTVTGANLGELVPSIVGTVFTDTNDNGKADAGEGGVANRVVFLNNDGTGSPTNNPHTTTDANGNFAFPHQAPGNFKVDEVLPANVTLSTGAATTGEQAVTVSAGQTTSGVLFGEIPSIAGTVFTDLKGTGTLAAGDPGVAGRVVFIDNDSTHKPDANNPSTTTDTNGNFTFTGLAPKTYSVEEVLPNNVTASATAPAVIVTAGHVATANLGELPSVTGLVFTDNNGNGTFDTGDTPLAGHTVIANVDGTGSLATNPSAITDANGNFALTGVPADKPYKIEDITSTGSVLASTSVQVTSGSISKNVNLAEVPLNSTISGTVFDDLNLNGKLDSGEPGVAGRTVFLNNDNTGQPDASNPSTTTDAKGAFSFTGLAPGTYTVSEVVTPDHGVTLTTATQTVTVVANGTQTGVNLGDALTSTLAPLPITANLKINNANQTTAYIDGVYEHLLGRAATAADISFWSPKVTSITSRAAMATSIWNSPEHRTLELDQFYHAFLNRAPDSQGQAYWLNAFTQSWGTEKNVIATFVTSKEYASQLHTSDADYIKALYTDLALRPADASGLSSWESALNNGKSRLQVAFAFIVGKEASAQLVDGYYADFLHRGADPAGSQSWVNSLTNGTASIEDVGVRILATDEYFGVVGAKSG